MTAAKHSPEFYSRLGSLGGHTRAAKLTSAERSASASKAGLASAEARRAKREARGEPEPTRRNDWAARTAPSREDLQVWYDKALAADPEASELELRRQAIALHKADLARIMFNQAQKAGDN